MKPFCAILAVLFLSCMVSDADAGHRHRRPGKFKTSVSRVSQETGIFRPRKPKPKPEAPTPAPKTPDDVPQFEFPDTSPAPEDEAPSDPVEGAGFLKDLDKEDWENIFEKLLFIFSLFSGISGGIAAESGGLGGIGKFLKKL